MANKHKSQMYSIIGIANWAKLFERNRDNSEYHEATDGITCLDLILDQEAITTLKETGSRLRPRMTEEGMVVKFRRPWAHPKIEAFGGAPKVVDHEDNPWDDSVSIGNGSRVEVFFVVYDTPMGKGTRMEGVRVLELVEYEAPNSGISDSRLPF